MRSFFGCKLSGRVTSDAPGDKAMTTFLVSRVGLRALRVQCDALLAL